MGTVRGGWQVCIVNNSRVRIVPSFARYRQAINSRSGKARVKSVLVCVEAGEKKRVKKKT